MSIHYKFKNSVEYDTVTFDGVHISVGELKRAIMQQKKLSKTDCDYLITDAESKKAYENDDALIPKNSSVIVSRIPLAERPRRFYGSAAPGQENHPPVKDTSSSAIGNITKSSDNATEEERISATIHQSTEAYDPSKFVRGRGHFVPGGPVPASYRCFRCQQPGHHIKDCPSNIVDNKRSTGIPRSFMVPCDQTEKGAYRTPDGTFARPIVEAEAYTHTKKEKPPTFASVYDPLSLQEGEEKSAIKIPEELSCVICHSLLKDAVLVFCCAASCCDLCIRTALIDSDEHECPVCHAKDVSPETLIPCLKLRRDVLKFTLSQVAPNQEKGEEEVKKESPVDEGEGGDTVISEKSPQEQEEVPQTAEHLPEQTMSHEEQSSQLEDSNGAFVPDLSQGLPPPPTEEGGPAPIRPIMTRGGMRYPYPGNHFGARYPPPIPGVAPYGQPVPVPPYPPRGGYYPPRHEYRPSYAPRRPLLGDFPPGYHPPPAPVPPTPYDADSGYYPARPPPSHHYPPSSYYDPHHGVHEDPRYPSTYEHFSTMNYDEAVDQFTQRLLRGRTRSRSRSPDRIRHPDDRRRSRSPRSMERYRSSRYPDERRRSRSRSPGYRSRFPPDRRRSRSRSPRRHSPPRSRYRSPSPPPHLSRPPVSPRRYDSYRRRSRSRSRSHSPAGRRSRSPKRVLSPRGHTPPREHHIRERLRTRSRSRERHREETESRKKSSTSRSPERKVFTPEKEVKEPLSDHEMDHQLISESAHKSPSPTTTADEQTSTYVDLREDELQIQVNDEEMETFEEETKVEVKERDHADRKGEKEKERSSRDHRSRKGKDSSSKEKDKDRSRSKDESKRKKEKEKRDSSKDKKEKSSRDKSSRDDKDKKKGDRREKKDREEKERKSSSSRRDHKEKDSKKEKSDSKHRDDRKDKKSDRKSLRVEVVNLPSSSSSGHRKVESESTDSKGKKEGVRSFIVSKP